MDITEFSEQLLLKVKMQEPTQEIVGQLEALSYEQLLKGLETDSAKKAFWINIYNAFFLILRKEKGITKPRIFRDKLIVIAGHSFSLDDIEHGILRKYRFKWSLGYLSNPFAKPLIKKLAVKKIDYRIHFALNCGAKSCPPIAFYSLDRLEQQLEMATLSFLEGETGIFPDKKEIHITRLFQWYNGDFGGQKGIRNILSKKLNIKAQGMKLVYNDYDWDEDLDNFRPQM